MDLNSIRDALKRQPFQQFTLRLADRRQVPVRHPEFVAMTPRIVVADEDSSVALLEPLLIVSLEYSERSGKNGNGKKNRRRGEG